MRRELAENLLAHIMKWTDAEKAEERQALDAFAAYKYDEYQQFMPGRRFLESLALWLRQFKPGERRAAYDFVRRRLIFISDAEMNHLVELVFPSFVRPHLVSEAAKNEGLALHQVKRAMGTPSYRVMRRQMLVLGLSDGARTDRFRRANPMDVSNEQIWHAYDVSDAKAEDIRTKLEKDIAVLLGRAAPREMLRFRTIVLLDDFTASGTSFLRQDAVGGWTGKIAKIVMALDSDAGLGLLVADEGVKVIVVVYVAAFQAIEHIEKRIDSLPFRKGDIEFRVVQRLGQNTRLDPETEEGIWGIAANADYFDPVADDEHGAVGCSSVQFGFADCRLPVILSHNTPNNSIFILWAGDAHQTHGLFPRVSRHRKFE